MGVTPDRTLRPRRTRRVPCPSFGRDRTPLTDCRSAGAVRTAETHVAQKRHHSVAVTTVLSPGHALPGVGAAVPKSRAIALRWSVDRVFNKAVMAATTGSGREAAAGASSPIGSWCNPWCNPPRGSTEPPLFSEERGPAPEHDTLGVTGSSPVAPTPEGSLTEIVSEPFLVDWQCSCDDQFHRGRVRQRTTTGIPPPRGRPGLVRRGDGNRRADDARLPRIPRRTQQIAPSSEVARLLRFRDASASALRQGERSPRSWISALRATCS